MRRQAECALHYIDVNDTLYSTHLQESSTSGPAQLSLNVLDDRAGLCYCLAQAIARHAELLAPVRELVVLIDVDARIVRTSYFLLVVRHVHLLSSRRSNRRAAGRFHL